RSLRRAHGVAARVVPPGAPMRAELTVAFDGVPAAGALRLDAGLDVAYDSGYPNELLAALWQAGALDADALDVRAVVTSP
ncbi:MAG: hypothetical protein IJT71_02895, partial [Oscillospiraceae bacterium]|nr:hypothetical protein [Oscillospiraceae bacterium]